MKLLYGLSINGKLFNSRKLAEYFSGFAAPKLKTFIIQEIKPAKKQLTKRKKPAR